METHLNIAVSPYIATYLLPKFLPEFFEEQPSVGISITVLQNDIAREIENNQFDIGIAREEPYTTKINSEKICEGKIALFYPQNDSQLTEVELFQKYKILSDNHPVYWNKVKQEISEIVPESQFVSIKDIAVTEKLIEMGQGISYLPLYLKMTLSPNIATRIPEEISIPLSFTYIMTRKNSEAIELFKDKFKEFIVFEQNKVNF